MLTSPCRGPRGLALGVHREVFMESEARKTGDARPVNSSNTLDSAAHSEFVPTWLIRGVDQQRIVLAIAVVLFALFSISLRGFIDPGNLLTLLQGVVVIGVLGLGMAIVIIGRGIDLSMIAVLVMPTAWMFVEIGNGMPFALASTYALMMAITIGILNGWLIAYLEVPAIFATLASGTLVYGLMQYLAVSNDIVPLPPQLAWASALFQGTMFGVPNVVVFFAAMALLTWLFLNFTVPGRFIYAIGDNPVAARITGVPVRPIFVLQYVLSAIIAVITGVVLAATVNSVNTRLFNSTMIYDVILVVVLGGVGLGGGKGKVSNVLVGTVLIGILINGMTIMNLSFVAQNLIKASILLLAILADSIVNPRDEQTSQQGDI
jgi:ribose transport system permease protein